MRVQFRRPLHRWVRFVCLDCGTTTKWFNIARLRGMDETIETWQAFWTDLHRQVNHPGRLT